MNLRAHTTKPAKLPDNDAHEGPSHHQEDHSFTGNKVAVTLQKYRKTKS
jgi:hypothetical protein